MKRHIKVRGLMRKPPAKAAARSSDPAGHVPVSPRFYTIEDLCRAYGGHRTFWSKQIRQGNLAARKIGKSYRVTPGALKEFLASHTEDHRGFARGHGLASFERVAVQAAGGGGESGSLRELFDAALALPRSRRAELLGLIARDLGDDVPGIESTPDICGGDPCIVRTRIPVWALEQGRRVGFSEADLLRSYPTLRAEDLVHAWSYVRMHPDEIERQIRENEDT